MSRSQRQSPTRYSLLEGIDYDDEIDIEKAPPKSHERKRRSSLYYYILILLIGTSCLALGFASGALVKNHENHIDPAPSSSQCTDPSIRREWRSLSRSEKKDYIDAVQCLRTTPSKLGLNQSLYDDFPYVHNRVGAYSHGSAAFLAWHRYFIHTYEQTLRNTCDYKGHATYWNWALDWENIPSSPIWDPTTGFGGTGNSSDPHETILGHCVTTGPFANLQVLYLESALRPHCLSRGFASAEDLVHLAPAVGPEAVEAYLRSGDYDAFNIGLEDGSHVGIPHIVRGDFSLFTAPYDPVFFLHHTQLDRLWWTWQRAHPEKRLAEYIGKAAHNSTEKASLADVIPMGGLGPDVTVRKLMNTEGGALCYGY